MEADIITVGERVKLCSQALARLNGPVISSFDEQTRESSICGLLYEDIYGRALCANRWSFTLKYALLTMDARHENSSTPAHRFMVPSDCIAVLGVRVPDGSTEQASGGQLGSNSGKLNGYSTQYELRGNYIYSPHSAIILDYQYRLPENQLTHCPLFRDYVICSLASEFALAVMNDVVKAQYFTKKMEDAYYLACSSDSAQSPNWATDSSTTLATMCTFG